MTADVIRLYISPLTPNILSTVLGPSLLDAAHNISYHHIQTFPESSYGYLDLPASDADRIRKKLSGSILKGSRMKVEEARPKKRRRADDEVEDQREEQSAKPTKSKKSRKERDADVIPGHELPPDRKVKRGWTEDRKDKKAHAKKDKKAKKEKSRESSKFTDKEELLFKTRVPPNKTDLIPKKSKKAKKTRNGKEESTVHEFEKTTAQPTFLKDVKSSNNGNLEYVDGKGWIDVDGAVVEAERPSSRPKREKKQAAVLASKTATKLAKEVAEIKSSEDGESDDDPSSPSDSSSSSESEIDQEASVGSSKPHPLESIFKKPTRPSSQDVVKPSLEITTGFSFFETDPDDIEDEPEVPLTPFTSQEMRNRGLRSAAPTPDTAHPSRFNSHDSTRLADDNEDGDSGIEEEPPSNIDAGTALASTATSDFEKMFWEKRGDNNRAWKARRRAVLKEKRHRENKARRPKNW
jgi:hypothetical protein